MRSKILSIVEYASLLINKYSESRQIRESNIYRIIEVKKSLSGQYKIIIQIIGKSSIFECSPQEIVANDRILEGFSKKDIRTITYFACEQIKKPKYKIMMQEFCEKFNRMVFKLNEVEKNIPVIRTANQIIMDKNFINNLSKEDVSSISYIAGYECFESEVAFFKKNNNEKLS